MPAVFVHGVPDTSSLWEGVRSHLSREDVVALNMPGFSTPVPQGFGATKDEYADWVIGELVAIGVPVDLVGHDWGSMIVQRVVSIRPDLIRTWAAGAGAVDPQYKWHELAQMWQTPEVGEQIMEAMSGEALVTALSEQMGEARAREVAKHVDDAMKTCILALYRSAVNVGTEWGPGVDTITKPGLVFWGADDPYVTRDFGERLAQRTGARLVMFPDSGHWWPVTKPTEVAQELERLWASV